jgi:hypothetical protein
MIPGSAGHNCFGVNSLGLSFPAGSHRVPCRRLRLLLNMMTDLLEPAALLEIG